MNSATFRLGYVCLAYLHSPPEIYEQDAEPASWDQGFGWEKISSWWIYHRNSWIYPLNMVILVDLYRFYMMIVDMILNINIYIYCHVHENLTYVNFMIWWSTNINHEILWDLLLVSYVVSTIPVHGQFWQSMSKSWREEPPKIKNISDDLWWFQVFSRVPGAKYPWRSMVKEKASCNFQRRHETQTNYTHQVPFHQCCTIQ